MMRNFFECSILLASSRIRSSPTLELTLCSPALTRSPSVRPCLVLQALYWTEASSLIRRSRHGTSPISISKKIRLTRESSRPTPPRRASTCAKAVERSASPSSLTAQTSPRERCVKFLDTTGTPADEHCSCRPVSPLLVLPRPMLHRAQASQFSYSLPRFCSPAKQSSVSISSCLPRPARLATSCALVVSAYTIKAGGVEVRPMLSRPLLIGRSNSTLLRMPNLMKDSGRSSFSSHSILPSPTPLPAEPSIYVPLPQLSSGSRYTLMSF